MSKKPRPDTEFDIDEQVRDYAPVPIADSPSQRCRIRQGHTEGNYYYQVFIGRALAIVKLDNGKTPHFYPVEEIEILEVNWVPLKPEKTK